MRTNRSSKLKPALAIAAIGGAVLLASCQTMDTMKSSMMSPTANAESVMAHLKAQNYRANWKFFPGKGALYKGQVPHGMLLTTYVNDAALGALNRRETTMPYGSIIVKENYTPEKTLAAVTTMYKVKGYNPGAGDWYWLKTAADGKVEATGKVAGCIGCHTPSKRDFLLTPL